jgi:ferredoxin
MPVYLTSFSDFDKLLRKLSADCDLYAPAELADNFYYQKIGPDFVEKVVYNSFRTAEPIKSFFFPLKERVATYPKVSPSEEPSSKRVIVGPKACDLKSLETLDYVFKEEDFLDPFYISKRENALLISSDCTSCKDSCFCTLVGLSPYPEKGFDLNLSQLKDGFLVETGSEKGKKIINENKSLFKEAGPKKIEERRKNREALRKELEEKNREYALKESHQEVLKKHFESKVWEEEAEPCVECAACTQVCPTCYCFLLIDETTSNQLDLLTTKGTSYQKVRVWDACQYPMFARVAGGANPRKRRLERLRHRYAHKFDYFVDNFNILACTGCGRCIEACLGKIDMRKVFKRLSEERVNEESLSTR